MAQHYNMVNIGTYLQNSFLIALFSYSLFGSVDLYFLNRGVFNICVITKLQITVYRHSILTEEVTRVITII